MVVSQNTKVDLPYDPDIELLDVYPEDPNFLYNRKPVLVQFF